jgi:RNA polymerase sigma-70 factor (ECF subfamily)
MFDGMVERLMETGTPVEVATEESFEAFFRAHYSNLARALLLLTGDRAEAEDLAQEAMARVFERWGRVAAMDSPVGYLYRTAFNLNRSRARRVATRARHLLPGPPPSDPADRMVSRVEVVEAVAALPAPQREAVVLVEWLDLDAEEAGRILGIEAVSVRGRLHRARATLRERLGDLDG